MTTNDTLRIMFVHAHPDDECLATGGVLARYGAEGHTTILVIATGGEEGEIVAPDLNTPDHRARLREIRDAELAGSVAALGVHTLERLGYRDSGMVGTPANAHPDCLHMADKDEATGRLVRLIRQHQPHVLVGYDERGGYWHPDHLACHLVTNAAFYAADDPERYPDAGPPWMPLKLYFTAWPRERARRAWGVMREHGMQTPLDNPNFNIARFTTRDNRVTTVVPIHTFLQQKRDAIACHVSQIGRDSPFLTMPGDLASEFFGIESFVRVVSRVDIHDRPEDDLFAGLR
jgi:mycothiol conjugate amidase Mca